MNKCDQDINTSCIRHQAHVFGRGIVPGYDPAKNPEQFMCSRCRFVYHTQQLADS